MKLHRVTTTANILLPVLAVFAAFYVFVTAWETVNFALLQPHWWLQDEWVDPDAQIATTTRADLFTPLVLTWHNATETMAPRFYFDSESAGLIICGGGFYLVGWIMSEAIKLADENEGFI